MKLPVIVAVDVSPRWNYGITNRECQRIGNHVDRGHEIIHERLNDLLCEASDAFTLMSGRLRVHACITIDLINIERIKWSQFRGHKLYLCGIYADWCVTEAGIWLQKRGYNVTALDDASLWGEEYQAIMKNEPKVKSLKHAMIADVFPELAKAHPDIWDGTVPEWS